MGEKLSLKKLKLSNNKADQTKTLPLTSAPPKRKVKKIVDYPP